VAPKVPVFKGAFKAAPFRKNFLGRGDKVLKFWGIVDALISWPGNPMYVSLFVFRQDGVIL